MNSLDDKISCTLTHIKRLNEGGERYPFIEGVGLYPNWDCNKWELRLAYNGQQRRALEIFTATELGTPTTKDILSFIFSHDYRHLTKGQFKKNNKYNAFFEEFGEYYGGEKEVARTLEGLHYSGCFFAGFLYKLLGREEFEALKQHVGQTC